MSNDLTGDFDVVVQFPVSTATRVLAAMHRGGRFPHSASIRIDDIQQNAITGVFKWPYSAQVDRFGDAIVDRHRVMPVLAGHPTVPQQAAAVIDIVVNRDPSREVALMVNSELEGVAQLQLSAPMLSVLDDSETGLTIHMTTMARYFPDAGTREMPEFVRGEIRVTVQIDQVASQVGNFIDIDLKAQSVDIAFVPAWSVRSLAASDVDAIERAIRNALKTSFQPSNAALPASVRRFEFKTFKPAGTPGAIGVLLNLHEHDSDRGSVGAMFLGGDDDFALAAGKDFITSTFDRAIGDVLDRQGLRSFKYTFEVVTRFAGVVITRTSFTYTVSLDKVWVELQTGQIVLAVEGRANTPSVLPNFSFRATQAFTLSVSGPAADLALLGDTSLTITTGGIAGWIVNFFRGNALTALRSMRDQALAQIQPTFRELLSADATVGALLTSLMNPTSEIGSIGTQEHVAPELNLSSFQIGPSGLVLHGALSVPAWPAPHVELHAIPGTGSNPVDHDYTALLSWIQGGTIREYLWRFEDQTQPFRIDPNTFVAIDPPVSPQVAVSTLLSGYVPICLTVSGDRCSASGPVALESVEASTCGWSAIPILKRSRIPIDTALPHIALVRSGVGSRIELLGHAQPALADSGEGMPNLVVYFAANRGDDLLDGLTAEVRRVQRQDALTAVVAVCTRPQLRERTCVAGVIYAEDRGDGAWARAFGIEVKRRPAIYLLGSGGEVLWSREGEQTLSDLRNILQERLTPCPTLSHRVMKTKLRVGHPAPDFIFSYAPDRKLTLRKLRGRPVVLVFMLLTTEQSDESVEELRKGVSDAAAVVIEIQRRSGDPPASPTTSPSADEPMSVIDHDGAIAIAYGVTVWPTTVVLDRGGLVREVRMGRYSTAASKE